MAKKDFLSEADLAALAKKMREGAGKRKIEAARELGVAPPAIFNAEQKPEMSLHKVRIRMIQAYSTYKVVGPVYYLKRK